MPKVMSDPCHLGQHSLCRGYTMASCCCLCHPPVGSQLNIPEHICPSHQSNVQAFHEKFGFAVNKPIESAYHDLDVDRELRVRGLQLRELAAAFQKPAEEYQANGDERLYRLHLMLEELGELAMSMGLRDPVLTADAIGDLDYVVTGTAVTFGLPIDALHEEIHASNMTKSRDLKTDHRMRRKDPALGYRKPDIQGVLNRNRRA